MPNIWRAFGMRSDIVSQNTRTKMSGDYQVKEARRFAAETMMKMVADVLVRFRSLVVIPCLTLAYGVKGYGVWILVDSAVMLFSQMLTLRLEAAIIRFLPECEGDKELMRRHFGILFIRRLCLAHCLFLLLL